MAPPSTAYRVRLSSSAAGDSVIFTVTVKGSGCSHNRTGSETQNNKASTAHLQLPIQHTCNQIIDDASFFTLMPT